MKRIAFVVLFSLSLVLCACSRNATEVANPATDDTLATGPTTSATTTAPAAVRAQPKPAPTSTKASQMQAVPAPE